MAVKPDMIVFMGVTGSGKSYLINKLAKAVVVAEGADLDSCTERCALVPAKIHDRNVILVDTPGFDDTTRSDSEILTSISNTLVAQYKLGFQLRGVIFIHRITDNKWQGSAVKTLKLFQEICGEMAFKNVVLLTSRWEDIAENLGIERERQLREDKWRHMIRRGSTPMRFYGTEQTALVIASHLLEQSNVVLELQREIGVERKHLNQTRAGSFIDSALEEKRSKYKDDLARLREELTRPGRHELVDTAVDERYKNCLHNLEVVVKEQEALKVDINPEVTEKLEKLRPKEKHRSKWKKGGKVALQILPTAIAVLGMLAGIPTGFGGIEDLLDGNGNDSTNDNVSALFDD